MNRREAIKGMTTLGAMAFLPSKMPSPQNELAAIHFIGLGGAGSNAVEYFHRKGAKGKFTCISNPERPGLSREIEFIRFIPPQESYFNNNGEEFFLDSDMKRKTEIPSAVLNIFKGNDKFILLAGLGGYTGTYVTEELTMLLHDKGKSFQTICSLPFKFEGPGRQTYAQKTLKELRHLPNFHYHSLDEIIINYGNMARSEAFEKANEELYRIYSANDLV